MTFVLTAGQCHEAPVLEQVMEQGAVKRKGRGRPKRRPQQVVGDKAYRSQKIRAYLKGHGIHPTIAHRSNEKRSEPFDRAAYRERNRVERLISRLKQFRRVATR
jgi:transposase